MVKTRMTSEHSFPVNRSGRMTSEVQFAHQVLKVLRQPLNMESGCGLFLLRQLYSG
jgi:hypothetical protein